MTLKDLNKDISTNNIKRVYFLYGEEQFLLEEKILSIKKVSISRDFEDLNYIKFDSNKTAVDEIIDAIDSYPMMSEKKLVLLKNTKILSNAKTNEFKKFKEYLKNIPSYATVIIEEPDFDKKKEKNIEFINELGGIVNFEFLPINQLELWLDRLFEKNNKQISSKDLSYMVKICGQSLRALYGESKKVISYMGDRNKVTKEDIDAVVTKSLEFKIYDIFNDITDNRSGKVMQEIKSLIDGKEKPTAVLSLITTKLSELLMVKYLKEDGLSANDMVIYFDFKIPTFVLNKTIAQSKSFGDKYLKRMIKKGLKYDIDMKTGKLDGWIAVQMYASELMKLD